MIRDKLLTISEGGDLYLGQELFDAPGDYRWTVPLSVRRIHVCAIGAGGLLASNQYEGGGGGALCWVNNLEVEPGSTIRVLVGAPSRTRADGRSGLKQSGDWLMYADGGEDNGRGGQYWALDGSDSGGGAGGTGSNGTYSSVSMTIWSGAGGGAGGYFGPGGNGVGGGAPLQGGAIDSGAGGGGSEYYRTSGSSSGGKTGGNGGGVGIMGVGATASGQPSQGPGASAKNGNPGSGGEGQKFGGGCSRSSADAGGAVRIIWGIKYSYPDNAVVDE